MFRLIKKVFIVLLSSIVNASNHTKCVSLSNQKCEIQPTLINLHPNKYRQVIHHYPFSVRLDRYFGGFNTLSDLFNKVQKQPPRGVLKKRCSENMQQIYRRTMPKCDFNKVANQLY